MKPLNQIFDTIHRKDDLTEGSVTSPKIAPHSVTADKMTGLSKLIFATCDIPASWLYSNQHTTYSCPIPGVASGDIAVATFNPPCDHCYGSTNNNMFVSSTRAATNEVILTVTRANALCGNQVCPYVNTDQGIKVNIIAFRQ